MKTPYNTLARIYTNCICFTTKMNATLTYGKIPFKTLLQNKKADDNIQLMHSFEVNIRICQPENSDVHRGEAEVNITFEG